MCVTVVMSRFGSRFRWRRLIRAAAVIVVVVVFSFVPVVSPPPDDVDDVVAAGGIPLPEDAPQRRCRVSAAVVAAVRSFPARRQ